MRQIDPVPPMTELEGKLAGPGGAALRDSLILQISAIEERLRRQLQASVPRDQYPGVASLAQATRAAQELLAQWPASSCAPRTAERSGDSGLQFSSPLIGVLHDFLDQRPDV